MLWNWVCFPTRRSIRASIGRHCCRRCFPDWLSSPASGRSLLRRLRGSGAANGRKVRSQVKGCDALFWIQLAARPNGPIHLASYLNLGARRSNFVLDAWKPSLTKIGLVATVERLDPCFVAYREAMDELKRRFPLAKFVWLPFGAHTDVFYPRKEEKSIFAFWLGRRYEPLHQASACVLRSAWPPLRLFQGRRVDHRAKSDDWRPARSTSWPPRPIWTIPSAREGLVRW